MVGVMQHAPRAMRSIALHSLLLGLPLSTVACGDEAPIYPPLPANSDAGGNGVGNNSSGARPAGSGGKGNTTNTGGRSGSVAGGAGNTGGAGNVDPLYAHCAEPWTGEDPPVEKVECDLDALQDGGSLTGDISADRTLESGYFYRLSGVTRVLPGKKLTIEPCVKVIGGSPDDVLVVMSGGLGNPAEGCTFPSGTPGPSGQLVAAGEPMAPIIFTSAKAPGQRAPGDWGGVILLGNARHNLTNSNTRASIEGLDQTECFGWHTNDFNQESSGKLEYVRIEYASRQTGVGNETNGLTLGAIGSATSVHHVMVANSNDDCFEWFGGTANAHHLIALNCDDDMFDADNSFSGQVQFMFGRQFPTTTETDSRGFEIDSGANPPPFTTASWSNFTVCGGGPTDTTGLRAGVVLRTQAQGTMLNGLVTGFAGGGFSVLTGGQTTLTHSHIFNVDKVAGDGSDEGVSWFTDQEGNSAEEPDRFCDCWAPRPIPFAATAISGGTPTGFEDPTASYVGAFEDAAPEHNWMRGLWVDWSEN